MNISLPLVLRRILLIMSIALLLCVQNINAQRIEVHGIKDLSTDAMVNKAWGVGGAIELDQLVKYLTFKINFDWVMYRDKINQIKPKYQKMNGGIAVCYSVQFFEKFTLQCGAELNYSYLKNSYIYDYEHTPTDTIWGKPLTLLQTGGFIGTGLHIGVQYKLSPRFNIVLNVVPTYLIPVHAKSSVIAIEPEYKNGIWVFPIKLGFSYQLFRRD